jgi:CRISPR-associated protein Cmr4
MITTPLFLYTETSLHAGVGSTVSTIDLPIQRERTTQFPIVQGSGIKGALRSLFHNVEEKTSGVEAVFGAIKEVIEDGQRKQVSFGGAVSIGDARIVLFPVRSLAGVFAYTTCPAVLARVGRDVPSFPRLDLIPKMEEAFVTDGNGVTASGKVVLEEFSFSSKESTTVRNIAKWLGENALPAGEEYAYWRNKVQSSLVILHDDAFRDFVQNSTEVVTRVKLDPAKKTVQEGALWTQEALPSDALLMSAVIVRSTRDGSNGTAEEVVKWLTENIPARIQLGGDETTGQGMVALRWV